MLRQAQKAIENAISLEIKKDGLAQRQSGDWQLRFTVSSTDMDQRLAAASMGTRYQCVLVEIDDNEEAVDHKAKERNKWRDLGPAKQAGIRCKDATFQAFLRETKFPDIYGEHGAAHAVRHICGIPSRSALGLPGQSDARLRWHELDNEFQAWKAADG